MYWKGTNASDCKWTAQAMKGREKSNEYNKFDSASNVKDYWLSCEKFMMMACVAMPEEPPQQ
jgi:hypothetical protein